MSKKIVLRNMCIAFYKIYIYFNNIIDKCGRHAWKVSIYYCFTHKPKSDYGIYPILILGLIALAKSIEFYEKYTYKLKSKR